MSSKITKTANNNQKEDSLSFYLKRARGETALTEKQLRDFESILPNHLMDWAVDYKGQGFSILQKLLRGPSRLEILDILAERYSVYEFKEAFHHVVVPDDPQYKTAFSTCLLFSTELLEKVIDYLGGSIPFENAKSYPFSGDADPKRLTMLVKDTDFLTWFDHHNKIFDYFMELKRKNVVKNIRVILDARPDLWTPKMKNICPDPKSVFTTASVSSSTPSPFSQKSSATTTSSTTLSSKKSAVVPSVTPTSTYSFLPPVIPTNIRSITPPPYSYTDESGLATATSPSIISGSTLTLAEVMMGLYKSRASSSHPPPPPSPTLKEVIAASTIPRAESMPVRTPPKTFASVAAASSTESFTAVGMTSIQQEPKEKVVHVAIQVKKEKKKKVVQEDDKDDKKCCVCLDSDSRVAFLPCKHLRTCVECSQPLNDCPICKAKIKQKITLFI